MALTRLWPVILGCCCFFVAFPGPSPRAALKDPGLGEAEIRSRWRSFAEGEKKFRVRGAYPFLSCFKEAAERHGVPLPLLLAVARGESDFDPNAASTRDCCGIMQIQWPGTARDLGVRSKSALFDPCVNIDAGARYLSRLLRRYRGDIYLAVAAYNYGPGAVGPGRVPRGAQWYAAYIHRHLRFVLRETYEKRARLLILEFTFYDTAVRFMEYLRGRVPGIPLEIFKSRKYTYDLYFTYGTRAEKRRYLKRLRDGTHIRPMGL